MIAAMWNREAKRKNVEQMARTNQSEYEANPKEKFDDDKSMVRPSPFTFSQEEILEPKYMFEPYYCFFNDNSMSAPMNFFPETGFKDKSLVSDTESISRLESVSLSETTKEPTSYLHQTVFDKFQHITTDFSALNKPEKSVTIPQLPVSINSKDVKCETSIRDSQDVRKQTSTNSQAVKCKRSMCNSENVECQRSMPDVLTSFYDPPNKYLIVENVQKNTERYCKSFGKDINSNYFYPSKKPESKLFATYQEESVEKKNEKIKKKGETKYFCKLPIFRTKTDYSGTIYHLKPSLQCLLCYKELTASFNILEAKKTLMIDEIQNDYLLPYQRGDVAGLVHRKCKMLKDPNCDHNNRYLCNLSTERKPKEPVNMRCQLYMLIIMLALIVSPAFMSFLFYNLLNSGISQYGTYTIIMYFFLFIMLAMNELFRYSKKMDDTVETMYLLVWKSIAKSNFLRLKNS